MDDAIQKRYKRDIDIIVNESLRELPQQPDAILLCGGYGRNEGAWYLNEKGDVCPYNDYDIAIVTETPLDRPSNNQLRAKLARLIGIKWVDIDFYSRTTLQHLTPTVHNVDLIYASTVLWGDISLKELCPKLDATRIGEKDIVKLFNTRMWTFMGSWNGSFRDLDPDKAMFFQNQMAKATLAGVDMRLIKARRYTTSYKERSELVLPYLSDNSEVDLVKWALAFKTRPVLQSINKDDMEKLYWQVKEFFCQSYRQSSSLLGKLLLTPKYSNLYYYLGTHYLASTIFSRLIMHSNRVKKTRDVYYAQSLIFFGNDNGNINNALLNKAAAILEKWGYMKKTSLDWNILRQAVSQARNNI